MPTNRTPGQDPGHDRNREDDFLPSDWSDDAPGAPAISDDFVERTLQRVLEDHAQIAAEAERVEEIEFPSALLEAFEVPEVSDDFVERTAQRIEVSRDADFREALASFTSPEPTEDFVDRTLLALKVERSPLRLVDQTRRAQAESSSAITVGPTPVPDPAVSNPAVRHRHGEAKTTGAWKWAALAVASAAALLVTFWSDIASTPGSSTPGSSTPGSSRLTASESTLDDAIVVQSYSPAAWSTELSELAALEADELVFHAPAGSWTPGSFDESRGR